MVRENRMTSKPSPEGRRILVAVVTGEAGERIQAWRLEHDREQAERLPPHTTLCYWAPVASPASIEMQLKHAFAEPVTVYLGGVREFDNDQHTFYVQVERADALNEARRRFYDGTHLTLPPLEDWAWHVTCVRDSRERDLDTLRKQASTLNLDLEWCIDTVAYMQLRGTRYVELDRFSV